MMELLKHLGKLNKYQVAKDAVAASSRILDSASANAKAHRLTKLAGETVYIEHLNFVNFTKFHLSNPIYINLVRDPVERMISWYFYVRGAHKNAIFYRKYPNASVKSSKWFKKDYNTCVRTSDPECVFEQLAVRDAAGDYRRQSLFFCGNLNECLPFNSPIAVQIAKQNVERYYAVVGSWEDTNVTLTVLENFIPRYFRDAKKVFEINRYQITHQNKNTRKPKIYDDVKEMIRKNFTHEYDFYHFCKQRLYKQYISLKPNESNAEIANHLKIDAKPWGKDALKWEFLVILGIWVAMNFQRITPMQSLNVRDLNNTRKAQLDLVFFNRVPKVGSQTFMELMRRLSERNNFQFHRDAVQKVETIRLADDQQQELAEVISDLPEPSVFIKHVCYTNFTKFSLPTPIYINVVRDPVERVISWFYYVRAPWYFVERKAAFPDLPLPHPSWLKKDFETCVLSGDQECTYTQGVTVEGIGDHRRQSLFFCGHDYECTPFNTVGALEKAKYAVESQYSVVGVLEDMNTTLSVFEKYIPRFFQGVRDIYDTSAEYLTKINKNNFKPPVSEKVKDIVRKNFTNEIEFYQFCRQRLHKQYLAAHLPQKIIATP